MQTAVGSVCMTADSSGTASFLLGIKHLKDLNLQETDILSIVLLTVLHVHAFSLIQFDINIYHDILSIVL